MQGEDIDSKDGHLEWPVLGYTLSSAVWILTHVWYRRTRGSVLFPRIVPAASATPEFWRECVLSCYQRMMMHDPHVVAMEQGQPPMVWSVSGKMWTEDWDSEFMQQLLQDQNVVSFLPRGGPETFINEDFGFCFYLQGNTQCVIYCHDNTDAFTPWTAASSNKRLILCDTITLPSQSRTVPYVIFGSDFPRLLESGSQLLSMCMRGVVVCETTSDDSLLNSMKQTIPMIK